MSNTIDYSGLTNRVVFGYTDGDPYRMWRDGGAEVDFIYGADTFVLTKFNDAFTASNHDTFVNAGEGNDEIYGAAGADVLIGAAGNDELFGKASHDFLDGGDGDDQLTGGDGDDVLLGGSGNDILNGGSGKDLMDGGGGNDTFDSDGLDGRLIGGEGIDTVGFIGAAASMYVNLEMNLASLSGTQTTRVDAMHLYEFENLSGSNFDDVLIGDRNANRIDGGKGLDNLTGGKGRDTFVYSHAYFGTDAIHDFTDEDILEFSSDLFANKAAVMAAAKDTALGALITSHSNTILLMGVTTIDLAKSNIIIVD